MIVFLGGGFPVAFFPRPVLCVEVFVETLLSCVLQVLQQTSMLESSSYGMTRHEPYRFDIHDKICPRQKESKKKKNNNDNYNN